MYAGDVKALTGVEIASLVSESAPIIHNWNSILTTNVSSFGRGKATSKTFSYKGKTLALTSRAN